MAATCTVLTLRSRRMADPPQRDELMASASGKTVYRILGVVHLRTAGDPAVRYRLICARLARAEVPKDAVIRPWRLGMPRAQPPRRPDAGPAPGRSQTASPAARPSRASPSARTRVVETSVKGSRAILHRLPGADFGPGLRRRDLRDRSGGLLREADVAVDDAAVDPRYPNRRVRRAYRVDPVDLMRKAGSIGPREADAAAELRRHLERMLPTLGAAIALGVSVSAFLVQPIDDSHIRAARKLREASAALGERLWPPVLWLCLGGSVKGYAAQWRCRPLTASALMTQGMTLLADHFYGRTA